MSNNTRYGFRPAQGYNGAAAIAHKWVVASGETIAVGDCVALNSAGRIALATASSAALCGVAATPVATATVGDPIYVYDDPNIVFEAMATTGALADPYTTATTTACFDLSGATAVQVVNTAATTYDLFRCVGIGKDPLTGAESAVGSNQMKLWMISRTKHQLDTN